MTRRILHIHQVRSGDRIRQCGLPEHVPFRQVVEIERHPDSRHYAKVTYAEGDSRKWSWHAQVEVER